MSESDGAAGVGRAAVKVRTPHKDVGNKALRQMSELGQDVLSGFLLCFRCSSGFIWV